MTLVPGGDSGDIFFRKRRTSMRQRGNLKREIVLALLIKGLLLYGLWWGFFSHKPDKQAVAAQLARQFDGAGRSHPADPNDFQQAKKESSP